MMYNMTKKLFQLLDELVLEFDVTMVSNMSLRYLKSFAINFPSKTRPK